MAHSLNIINKSNLPEVPVNRSEIETPFDGFVPAWEKMEEAARKYGFIERLILVANGGSINTFRGIYQVLKTKETPEVVFLDTNEPASLHKVRQESDPEKTLLLSVSKSGENMSQIEATIFLLDLPNKIFLTGPSGVLREIASSYPDIDVLDHPAIGGRFAGLSEVGLLPALLCGFTASDLLPQAVVWEDDVKDKAWQTAAHLWELEQSGYAEILLSNYSQRLDGFGLLIQQLMHETYGKDGLGQTFVPVSSPESQHHTSQRLFGGRPNMAALFTTSQSDSMMQRIPEKIASISFKGKQLADFEGLDLARSHYSEYASTQERCHEKDIPNLTVDLNSVTTSSVGEYIRFWQMTAVYGAHLRNLNPYDQPEVEAVKVKSLSKRLEK